MLSNPPSIRCTAVCEPCVSRQWSLPFELQRRRALCVDLAQMTFCRGRLWMLAPLHETKAVGTLWYLGDLPELSVA